METKKTTRQLAMEWWNKITFEEKWSAIVNCKDQILGYPYRSPLSLTGREIEILHKNKEQ